MAQNEQQTRRPQQNPQPRWLREFLARPRTIEAWIDGVEASSEAYRVAGRVMREGDFEQNGSPEPEFFLPRELGVLESWLSPRAKEEVFERLDRQDRRPTYRNIAWALKELQGTCNSFQVAAVRAMKALSLPFPQGGKFADVVRDFAQIVGDGLKAVEKSAIDAAGRLRRAGVGGVPTDKEIRGLGDERLLVAAGELGAQLKELLAPKKAATASEPAVVPPATVTPDEAEELGWDGIDVTPTPAPSAGGTNGQPRAA